MKIRRMVPLILLLLIVSAAVTFAQGALVIHAGAALPSGDFGKDDPLDRHDGLAGTGAAAGAAWYHFLRGSALGWFASADLLAHPCSGDARDAWQTGHRKARITLPSALLLPLSGGILYTLKEDKKASLFLKAGFTGSLIQYTRLEVKESPYETYSEEYDLAFSPGYVVGAGIAGSRLILEADYYSLGEAGISGTWQEGKLSGTLPAANKKVALLAFTLGWKF